MYCQLHKETCFSFSAITVTGLLFLYRPRAASRHWAAKLPLAATGALCMGWWQCVSPTEEHFLSAEKKEQCVLGVIWRRYSTWYRLVWMIIYESWRFLFWAFIKASWWLFSVRSMLFIIYSLVCGCTCLYCGSNACSFFHDRYLCVLQLTSDDCGFQLCTLILEVERK